MEDDGRLRRDLSIAEAMAAELQEYLRHEVLFWPLSPSSYPRLTIGGFLMRRHRLQALTGLLDPSERNRLDKVKRQFNQILDEHVVALEQRAQWELEARLRQWQAAMRDWEQGKPSEAIYAAAAETRTMIAAILDQLGFPPFQLEEQMAERVAQLDRRLRQRWRPGDFIWPETWQSAYPQDEYWWLYGMPK